VKRAVGFVLGFLLIATLASLTAMLVLYFAVGSEPDVAAHTTLVLRAGGDYRVAWPVQRTFEVADAAVGMTTLSDLYRDMKDDPMPIDLTALWRELGVEADKLRDDAPLAAVRRAILA